MKKAAKFLGYAILALLIVLVGLYIIFNEKLPEGTQGKEADALAYKMLDAVNHEAYKNTKFLEWNFNGMHDYVWNKEENSVEVSWDNYRVILDTKNPESSIVFLDNTELGEESKKEIISKAVDYFNNDSFWLVAPHKIFDPGTERRIVKMDNGEEALLVSYTSGGSTPGDSYLWLLDENGLPKSFKMWVKIIPIGGLEAAWDSWTETESGVLLPTSHKFLSLSIDMGEVRAYN